MDLQWFSYYCGVKPGAQRLPGELFTLENTSFAKLTPEGPWLALDAAAIEGAGLTSQPPPEGSRGRVIACPTPEKALALCRLIDASYGLVLGGLAAEGRRRVEQMAGQWRVAPMGPLDARDFYQMLPALDWATDTMMFEPGERQGSLEQTEQMVTMLEQYPNRGLLLGLWQGGALVGFLMARRESAQRNRHTAYLVLGMLPQAQGHGMGKRLLETAQGWGVEQGLARLELTVECQNQRALALYKKCGFQIEGCKRASMWVAGAYRNEYYMSQMLPALAARS